MPKQTTCSSTNSLIYQLAFLNGDADGMQRQMKWSEGKPSEYLLLNEATLWPRRGAKCKRPESSCSDPAGQRPPGFQGDDSGHAGRFFAVCRPKWATLRKRKSWLRPAPLWRTAAAICTPVAVALAMTGDVSRAQSHHDELGRRFPDDTILHQVSIPCVRALIEVNHKSSRRSHRVVAGSDAL